jgi:hypothetical protein
VRHLDDGALRRLYDEPLALEDSARAHYNGCPECQRRFSAVAEDARHGAALMTVPGVTVDAQAALARARSGLTSAPRRLSLPEIHLGWRKPAVAGLLAAGLAASLAFTPLAATVKNVFEPTTVQTVSLSQGDLKGLDAFSNWGDVKQNGNTQLQEAASATEASSQSKLPVIQLKSGSLPAKLATAPVNYGSVGRLSGSVVFSNKAPSELHGTTLTVTAGPGEAVIYGDVNQAMAAGRQAKTPQDAAAAVGPMLAVVEMQSPQVSSNGKSVAQIKKVLTSQKGLSKNLKDAINKIDDPKGNLPILIPVDYATSQPATVQGHPATFVGDNTKLGAGVIWVNAKKHHVYAVVGLGVSQDEIMAAANGLQNA